MQCEECMCAQERDLSREGEQSNGEGTRGESRSCRLIETEREGESRDQQHVYLYLSPLGSPLAQLSGLLPTASGASRSETV